MRLTSEMAIGLQLLGSSCGHLGRLSGCRLGVACVCIVRSYPEGWNVVQVVLGNCLKVSGRQIWLLLEFMLGVLRRVNKGIRGSLGRKARLAKGLLLQGLSLVLLCDGLILGTGVDECVLP